jgi:hypothetical protein
MLPETRSFRERDGNCHFLAESRWKMLLKAVRQLLGTAKRVLESHWEMPKGYWKAAGKFLKGIGKLLGMPKYLPSTNRRGGRIAQWLLAKTWQFSSLFSEAPHFCLKL